jgi:hypothetical protein
MKLANFNLFPVSFAASATADTGFTVTHGCEIDGKPVVPRGVIITRRFKAAQLYFDTSTWTNTTVTLKSDTASAAFNVLFVA